MDIPIEQLPFGWFLKAAGEEVEPAHYANEEHKHLRFYVKVQHRTGGKQLETIGTTLLGAFEEMFAFIPKAIERNNWGEALAAWERKARHGELVEQRAALAGQKEGEQKTIGVVHVGDKKVPVRRMRVTKELADRAIGDSILWHGKVYEQCPLGTPGRGLPDIEEFPPDAWMYVLDDSMSSLPIITLLRWPAYTPPAGNPERRTRFREIPLWELPE